MPLKDALVYCLYEIVQNRRYAYKAVLNEKFGDSMMSKNLTLTKEEKRTDKKCDQAKIMKKDKWCVLLWLQYLLTY